MEQGVVRRLGRSGFILPDVWRRPWDRSVLFSSPWLRRGAFSFGHTHACMVAQDCASLVEAV
jgi:hypothetical protein